ncbi:hypothetical protein [Cytobacillus praedii]|uniref:hypothetical protein n=1 Tax=Cytobacillus praedii TaxID=1742358 RepID=UPI00070FEFEF|nr:hypothetical protein [Cytobacillus praedii]
MAINKDKVIFGALICVIIILILIAIKISGNSEVYPQYEDGVTIEVINESQVKIPYLKFSLGQPGDQTYESLGSIDGLDTNKSSKIYVPEIVEDVSDLSLYIHYKDANDKWVLDSPFFMPTVNPGKVVAVITIKEVTESGHLIYIYEGYNGWKKVGPYKNDLSLIDYVE